MPKGPNGEWRPADPTGCAQEWYLPISQTLVGCELAHPTPGFRRRIQDPPGGIGGSLVEGEEGGDGAGVAEDHDEEGAAGSGQNPRQCRILKRSCRSVSGGNLGRIARRSC